MNPSVLFTDIFVRELVQPRLAMVFPSYDLFRHLLHMYFAVHCCKDFFCQSRLSR